MLADRIGQAAKPDRCQAREFSRAAPYDGCMTLDAVTKSKRRPAKIVAGFVVVAVGIVGVIAYLMGMPDALAPEGAETGLARGLTIVLSAVLVGTGLVLIVVGLIQRRRSQAS